MSVHTPVRNPVPSLRSGSFLFTVSLVCFFALLQESVGWVNIPYEVCVIPRRYPLYDTCMRIRITHEDIRQSGWFTFRRNGYIFSRTCVNYTSPTYSVRRAPITNITTKISGSGKTILTPGLLHIHYNNMGSRCFFQEEFARVDHYFNSKCIPDRVVSSAAVLTRASLTSMLGAILLLLQCL